MSATTLGSQITGAAPAAVLDTNVVLDLWVFRDPRVQALGQALAQGHLCWLGCPGMRQELAHVLGRGLAQAREVAPQTVLQQWDAAVEQPLQPDPTAVSRLHCSDPDDQPFVELALAHHAKWLFTSDRALLKLARRAALRGLSICSPYGWSTPGMAGTPAGDHLAAAAAAPLAR